MSWHVEFKKEADVDLARLDATVRQRVAEKIDWLLDNFGYFKLRAGDWRVVYKINYAVHLITVYGIDHRVKAYKKR